ncbi:MAG: tetratricopeptide repeat protein [Anaerolineae bacterium]|nr:tetratricopeptide repeat protein [Anaerolineae bacterium]
MGISLKDRRRRTRRRSYASYRPPDPNRGPRNDPFRIIFYLAVIGFGIWAYRNLDTVIGWIPQFERSAEDTEVAIEETNTPGPSFEEIVAEAEQAYLDGNLDVAVEHYQTAAELTTDPAPYYSQIARLLIFESAMQYGDERVGTLDLALEAANNAVLSDPFDPAGYAIMGKIYDWQGRADQASSTILQAIDVDPNYAIAQSYYAEALVDLDRWDQALEAIEYAVEQEPESFDIRRDYGYVLESLGNYEESAAEYEMAVQLHSRLPFIRVSLARIYRVLGRYDEALDQLFEAQVLAPSSVIVPFELGVTYETYLGDPSTALEYYERSVELDPAYGRPWLRIGTLRYYLMDYTGASVALEKALELQEESDDLYYQLGLSYAYQGQCSTAIRFLEEAQRRAEEDERILDAVQEGFDYCSQPTPVPVDVLTTPEIESE